MEEKGILTPEQEKKLAGMLDDIIKLKGILEMIDGLVFKALITFVDDRYADKLKEEIKLKLAALVDAVMAEDLPLCEQLAADIINTLIDIPGLDEEAEGLIFKGVIELLVGVITKWIEDKKQAPVTLKIKR
jgi:hypothetical protein